MVSSLSKRIVLICVPLVLLALTAPSLAQDPIEPPEGIPVDSDWLYRKHYEQVQEIMQTPDLSQRAAKLETYMNKLHEKAKIRQYMEGFFTQIVREMTQAGQNAKAAALTEKMTRLFPNSAALAGQAFQTAFQNGDYPKAIKLGEKLYADNPNPQIAVILAQSYIATQNAAKAEEYSLKALESLGSKKGVYFAVWLADYYAAKGDQAGALKYYNTILSDYPSGPPQGWQPDAWDQIKLKAYTFKGSDLYSKKDHRGAIEAFQKVLQIQPQNDAAYLFIGLSHWQLKELDEAMNAFAKAVVLEKANSAKAREYLEQIYKPRNNDSLDGLNDILAKARSELGTG